MSRDRRIVNNATKKDNTMAQNPAPTKPATASTSKPVPPTPPTKPTNGGMSAAQAKATGEKRPRVRWQSVTDPNYWVRSYKDITDKYGAPRDFAGKEMVPGVARGGFQADPARKQAKAEREAKLAAMSPEEKLLFLKTERETRRAAKTEREANKLALLKDQLRKELEAELAAKK